MCVGRIFGRKKKKNGSNLCFVQMKTTTKSNDKKWWTLFVANRLTRIFVAYFSIKKSIFVVSSDIVAIGVSISLNQSIECKQPLFQHFISVSIRKSGNWLQRIVYFDRRADRNFEARRNSSNSIANVTEYTGMEKKKTISRIFFFLFLLSWDLRQSILLLRSASAPNEMQIMWR